MKTNELDSNILSECPSQKMRDKAKEIAQGQDSFYANWQIMYKNNQLVIENIDLRTTCLNYPFSVIASYKTKELAKKALPVIYDFLEHGIITKKSTWKFDPTDQYVKEGQLVVDTLETWIYIKKEDTYLLDAVNIAETGEEIALYEIQKDPNPLLKI